MPLHNHLKAFDDSLIHEASLYFRLRRSLFLVRLLRRRRRRYGGLKNLLTGRAAPRTPPGALLADRTLLFGELDQGSMGLVFERFPFFARFLLLLFVGPFLLSLRRRLVEEI
jgi:hypothetical protein